MFPHRTSIFQDTVGETAVALSSDLNFIGALEEKCLLEVASSGVHVGNAVLTVVGHVLRCLRGHETQESHLDVDILWQGAFTSILKLCRKETKGKNYWLEV